MVQTWSDDGTRIGWATHILYKLESQSVSSVQVALHCQMSSSIHLLLWALLLLLSGANCQTTPAIERIFLGRCSYFKQFGLNRPTIDCTRAYNAFVSAFAFKDPCNITMAAYDEYFNLTKQVLPRDKASKSRVNVFNIARFFFALDIVVVWNGTTQEHVLLPRSELLR